MELLTIRQLDDWMTAHCYPDSYAVGNRIIHEGYGLSLVDGFYDWYYTERGERHTIQRFTAEWEAVAFAFTAITADKTANRHLVGFMDNETTKQALLTELANRRIPYREDTIPFGGLHDLKTRVFVFGCAIQRALDLQKKYGIRHP